MTHTRTHIYTPAGDTMLMISFLPPYAPTGRPPPMTLPMQVRSGVTPKYSWAQPCGSRKTNYAINGGMRCSDNARRSPVAAGRQITRLTEACAVQTMQGTVLWQQQENLHS
eukprot:1151628-Pelagomonas_calceolata.AAC.4